MPSELITASGHPRAGATTLSELPFLAMLAFVWLLAIDSLTLIPVGPISASGMLTLGGGIISVAVWPMLWTGRIVPLTLHLFLGYALLRLMASPTPEGIQNVSVYATFIVIIGLAGARISPLAAEVIGSRYRIIGVVASTAFLVAGFAGVEPYGARSFALAGLIYLAALIPHRPRGRLERAAPYFVALAVVASLSRTAGVIALLMFAFLSVRDRKRRGSSRFIRGAALAGLAAGVGYWLITYYEPLRQRFLVGDGASLAGIQMNTSGRAVIWEITIESASRNPIFGMGAGSANAFVASELGAAIGHPHNDYLRLLHDFGWIGLVLFTLGMVQLLTRSWRRAARTNSPVHWSAVLGIMAVLLAAVTDNVIVYPFVMVPLGLLVGASLGLDPPPRKVRRKARHALTPV